ncbi:MAG: hypothetical protein M5U34_11555 [Chloroflexi bacterium]|nr:hypothetical protein [Chloroflexota bacterium]
MIVGDDVAFFVNEEAAAGSQQELFFIKYFIDEDVDDGRVCPLVDVDEFCF